MPTFEDVHADRIVFPVELILRPWVPAEPTPRVLFPVQHPYVEITGRVSIFDWCECAQGGAR